MVDAHIKLRECVYHVLPGPTLIIRSGLYERAVVRKYRSVHESCALQSLHNRFRSFQNENKILASLGASPVGIIFRMRLFSA